MTLLEKLESHRGGLIRLPTQLFWYGRGWDNTPLGASACCSMPAPTAPSPRPPPPS